MDMIEKCMENLKEKHPVVQCITNFVTVNDCANIVLACGGSPTMAHDRREAAEINQMCHSLVLNIGTVEDSDVEAMILAGKESNQQGKPVILDPVAVGASKLRRDIFDRLKQELHLDVIRGNISEIKYIACGRGNIRGVDAGAADEVTEANLPQVVKMAKELAEKMDNIIVISGRIDIVTDGKKTYILRNGHEMMSRITGTGCMSTALIGSFCGANPDALLSACTAAGADMGIAGELSFRRVEREEKGTLSFRTYLIDYVSRMTAGILREGVRIEEM